MTSLFRSILLLGFAGIASELSASPAPSREIVLLSNGWRFNQGDVADAQAPGFADGTWAMFQAPHTWNRVGYYLRDPRMHVNRVEDINKVEGPAWYRLSFVAPKEAAGRKAWLEFDAVSRTAEVRLNSHRQRPL